MAPPADDTDAAMWPPGITADDAPALDALAAAGWGEGDGADHGVPADLVELHQLREWQAALDAAGGAA